MPIYEYQCDDCGHRLEKLQKIADAALSECPNCQGAGLKKLVSAAAFRLKGSGWYETDFKEDKAQKNLAQSDNQADDKADDKPGDKSSDKANGKPDDKPAPGKGKTDNDKAGKEKPKVQDGNSTASGKRTAGAAARE